MAHVSEHGGMDATNLINPIDGFETLLRVLGRWADRRGYLVYKAEEDGAGGLMKFPVDPETGLMTAPNRTEDRAVLTLVDAIGAATDLLAKGEGFFGVGMATERVGLVAVDLDSCLIRNGIIKLNAETIKMLGGSLESYTEVSPSGGGARMLIDGLPDFAKGMATGAEVCGVGLYYTSKKFVTLTGLPLAGSPAEIRQADQTVAQIANHIAKYRTAEVLDGWSRTDMSMKQAEAAILEGSSLHDATMAWLTKAWNRLDMTEQEVSEGVYALYDRSAARGATPARWGQRRRGIARQLDWVRKTFGRRARKIEDLPTQVVERAFANVRAFRERKGLHAANEGAEPTFDPDQLEDGPWVLQGLYGALDLTADEALALQAVFERPWDRCGKEGRDLIRDMRAADEIEDKLASLAWTPDDDEEAALERRDWIIEGLALRGYQTLLVGSPGVSKTTFAMTLGAHLAAGKEYGDLVAGEKVAQPKVLLILAEEDEHEVKLRMAAIKRRFRIKGADMGGRLMVMDRTKAPNFRIGGLDDTGRRFAADEESMDLMGRLVQRHGIDLIIADPLAKLHGVPENDNDMMTAALRRLTQFAGDNRVGVLLVHHTPKNVDSAGNMWAGRGASALVGEVKNMVTLTTMTAEMGEAVGVGADRVHHYARRDDAKANNKAMLGRPVWYERESVELANGEAVGVLVPTEFTAPEAMMNVNHIAGFMNHVRTTMSGPSEGLILMGRNQSGAGEAVVEFMAAFEIVLSEKQGRRLIRDWIGRGLLASEDRVVGHSTRRAVLVLGPRAGIPEVQNDGVDGDD